MIIRPLNLTQYSKFKVMIILKQHNFSDDEKKVSLKHVGSHRGMRRALGLGDPFGVGVSAGVKKANKLDEEGKSDEEILRGAKKAAAKKGALVNGALTGGTLGTLGGLAGAAASYYLTKGKIKPAHVLKGAGIGAAVGAGVGAGAGATGGYFGAKKNTEDRLAKRKALQEEINKKK